MPRPCKQRRICALPGCCRFGPQEPDHTPETLTMTLDEYEALRLIDLESLSQEECADRMGVARTTAQAIYNSARRKLADCLVNQKELHIEGGHYRLCGGGLPGCAARRCPRVLAPITERNHTMKIAVTYENGEIFQHFGHTEQLKIYTVENGQVPGSDLVNTLGSGHGALAGFLQNLGVDTLICGGIGGGARQALAQAGIQIYGGVQGRADLAVTDLLAGRLLFNPEELCSHHGEGHGEGHHCGGHSCADHSCHN